MSGQGLLNTVFSCSSPASKTISKRRLRQTRSLDPAIIRNYGTDTEYSPAEADSLRLSCPLDVPGALTPPASVENVCAPKVEVRSRSLKFKQNTSSFSSPCTPAETSPSSNFQFDYDFKGSKRNTAWDLPFLAKMPPSTPPGSVGTIFSPRKWLQKKLQQTSSQSYIVWKSEVGLTVTLSWMLKWICDAFGHCLTCTKFADLQLEITGLCFVLIEGYEVLVFPFRM
ncbi:RHG06 protein, partial [Polypterus senegalus]